MQSIGIGRIQLLNLKINKYISSNFAFFKKPLSAADVTALYENGQGYLHNELPVQADNWWSFNNTLQEDASGLSFKNTTWSGTASFKNV